MRMAMIASIELDDFVAFGKSAREADGGHRGFRARVAHANFLHAWHQRADQFRHRDLEWVGNAEARACLRRLPDRLDNFGMGMAEDGRPPGADIIHVFVTVHVPDARAFGFVYEKRLAADRAKRAPGRVHPPGEAFE